MLKKFSAIFLSISIFSTVLLSACSPTEKSNKTQDDISAILKSSDEIFTDEAQSIDAPDNLPASLDFNGETLNFLVRNSSLYEKFDMIGEENSGDVVFDAIYKRNSAVEDRLNLNINMEKSKGSNLTDVQSELQKIVMSASDDYDLFASSNNSIVQFGMVDYLRVFNNAPYLNFDSPWWWTQSMLDLSLDGNTIQYLIGDMLMSNILTSAVIYANKGIWETHFGDSDKLYHFVKDGRWTLDLYSKYCRDVYNDLNGDGKLNEGDIVGMYANNYQTIDYFSGGSDLFFTDRDNNGYVVLNPPNDRAITFTEKMIDLYFNNNATFIFSGDSNVSAFVEDRCLFLPETLFTATNAELRDMKTDYAILPIPKLDEEQDSYKTLVYGHSGNVCVPITVNDETFHAVCASLEALCAESYRSVTKCFYDTALKVKYSRDELSGQMLDIITESSCKSFSNEYAAQLANIGDVFKKAIMGKNMVVMSIYESISPVAQNGLDELMEKVESLE